MIGFQELFGFFQATQQGLRHVVNDCFMSAADPNDGDNWFNRFFSGQPGKQSHRKRAPDTSEL